MPGTNRGRADDALARQVIGERLAARALALEGGDGQGLCGGGLGDQLILAGIGLEVFELQLHLRQEALAAFCAGSVRLALQLGDLQLEVGDHRLGGALARLCVGEPCLGLVGSPGCRVQQRLERCDVVRNGRNGGFHAHE